MTTRVCRSCRTEKPLDVFVRDPRRIDGYRHQCRSCRCAAQKRYVGENGDKVRLSQREYYRANRETIRAKKAEYNRANSDKTRIRHQRWNELNPGANSLKCRAYYAKNSDRVKSTALDWAKRNPEACCLNAAKRKARKSSSPGRGVSGREWQQIRHDSLGLCVYCNARQPRLTLDHIEPLAHGGAHDVDNAAAACRSCNCSKSDTPLVVWLAVTKRLRTMRAAA
jgi:hypothetical protein